MHSLKVGPENRLALEAIASSLRRRAGLSAPSYSTRKMVEVCFPGTLVTGRELPEGVHDVVRIDSDAFRSHRAPHVIIYRRGLSTAEQRHAIIHALAHIVFDGAAYTGCAPFSENRELRCDRFADEALAPLEEVRAELSGWPRVPGREWFLDKVDQLASRFHVPAACIQRRIRLVRSR